MPRSTGNAALRGKTPVGHRKRNTGPYKERKMELVTQENWLQAQYSVLGAVLIDENTAPKVVQQMRQTDFFGACRTVFKAILKLFQEGQPVDPVTVVHALGPGYMNLIKQLMEITPSVANLDTYMKLCREQAQLVTVREMAGKLAAVEDNESARKLLEEAMTLMVDKTSVQIFSMDDCMKAFYDRHTGEIDYLNWPIPVLNDVIDSEPGDYIVIGGRPSTGKSAFGLQCAQHWSKNMKVGFFSLETRENKLFDRLVSSIAKIGMKVLKRNKITDQQWRDLAAISPEIIGRNLELIRASSMSVADIRAVTMMRGYDIIIVDYLQLIIGSGHNRTEEVSGLSLALHRMAQDLGVTVVALAQVRRFEPGQKNRRIDNSDLKESGQIEQDADIILLLQLTKEHEPEGTRDLIVSKNKEGERAMTVLSFDGTHQTFSVAPRTGAVIGKLIHDGKKAKQERAAQARNDKETYTQEQFTMLPPGTPGPFED